MGELHDAAYSGRTDVAKVLLDQRADINALASDGYTPLFLAVRRGHTDMIKLLLERGASVNAKSRDGWTALHVAVFEVARSTGSSKEAIQLLIKNGANVNSKTNSGDTPLALSDGGNSTDAATILKAYGATK
jgi:ankyrin